MKSSEKGIGQQVYKFSFTQVKYYFKNTEFGLILILQILILLIFCNEMQIFGPTCTLAEFFEGTISSQVHDFVLGKNALVFSYGVTNAGKTYTIQGELNRHSHGICIPRYTFCCWVFVIVACGIVCFKVLRMNLAFCHVL